MRLTKSVAHLKDRCPEHGFRPLKAGKMHPNALKTLPSGAARQGGAEPPLPRSASAPQVYVVTLSSHLFMLRVQFCNTALTHRGVLGANPSTLYSPRLLSTLLKSTQVPPRWCSPREYHAHARLLWRCTRRSTLDANTKLHIKVS